MNTTEIERGWLHVDTLGPIPERLYPIAEHVTSPEGLDQLRRMLPNMAAGKVNIGLTQLKSMHERIRTIGLEDFIIPLGQRGHLGVTVVSPFDNVYRYWQGAVSEVACLEVVRRNLPADRHLLSGQQMIEQVTRQSMLDSNLYPEVPSFSYTYHGVRYCVPDALSVTNGEVDLVYEFKTGSRIHQRQSRHSILRLFRDEQNIPLMQEVIGELTDVPAAQVVIPLRENDISVWLVALEDGLDQSSMDLLKTSGFGNVDIVGISARGLACLALEFFIGKKRDPLAYYSMAVTEAEARTLREIRGIRRVAVPSRHHL